MRSVKPGRALSFLNLILSVALCGLAISWISNESRMGAPGTSALYRWGYLALAVVYFVYHLIDFIRKSRFSAFDITRGVCPSCEKRVGGDDPHCSHCGGKLH